MDDGATVPLFLQEARPAGSHSERRSERGICRRSVEDENLDDAQQAKLEKQVRAGDRGHQARRPARDYRGGHRLSLPAARLPRQRHGRLARQVHRREDVRQGSAALEGSRSRSLRGEIQEVGRREREETCCRSSWITCGPSRWPSS